MKQRNLYRTVVDDPDFMVNLEEYTSQACD